MNFANRTYKLPLTSTGVVNAVMAIILILGMLGACIKWFGTTVGLLSGGALAAAVCSILILLLNIQEVLEESRESEQTPHGRGKK